MTRPEAIAWLTLIRDLLGWGLGLGMIYLAGFGHGLRCGEAQKDPPP